MGKEIYIKLDFLAHSYIQGNKWRKLKYLLMYLESKGCAKIASMGGAYSNHLQALCQLKKHQPNWQITVFVRGEKPKNPSPILLLAKEVGLELVYTERTQYKTLRSKEAGFEGDVYWVPEGGTTPFSNAGCAELAAEIMEEPISFSKIMLSGGSGGTAAGILNHTALPIWVHTSLKGFDFKDYLSRILVEKRPFEVVQEQSGGKFGKTSLELLQFIDWFEEVYPIPLDKVYTAKLFYWLFKHLDAGNWPDEKILVIHTGGLAESVLSQFNYEAINKNE